jgi:hypothetical protein
VRPPSARCTTRCASHPAAGGAQPPACFCNPHRIGSRHQGRHADHGLRGVRPRPGGSTRASSSAGPGRRGPPWRAPGAGSRPSSGPCRMRLPARRPRPPRDWRPPERRTAPSRAGVTVVIRRGAFSRVRRFRGQLRNAGRFGIRWRPGRCAVGRVVIPACVGQQVGAVAFRHGVFGAGDQEPDRWAACRRCALRRRGSNQVGEHVQPASSAVAVAVQMRTASPAACSFLEPPAFCGSPRAAQCPLRGDAVQADHRLVTVRGQPVPFPSSVAGAFFDGSCRPGAVICVLRAASTTASAWSTARSYPAL